MASRQQQGARRALAEPGREQRRATDLGGDQWFDLVGVEHEKVCTRRGFAGVRQPDDDAVIGGGRLLVDAVALVEPLADHQGERPVHPQSVGGVQDDPPVAELVAEPLDEQRRVRGHRAGGGALLVEQPPQVLRREVVETDCPATLVELLPGRGGRPRR